MKCHKARALDADVRVVAFKSWLGRRPACSSGPGWFCGPMGSISLESMLIVLFTRVSYEKPTCTGCSMYIMFTLLFSDQGFRVVLLESRLTKQGPASEAAA